MFSSPHSDDRARRSRFSKVVTPDILIVDSSKSFDDILTMSTTSNTSSRRPSSRDYITGFPDSFAGRTTSLRHPDANTAPGASISAEDIDPARTLQRSRRSFHNKYKRTISYGKITPEMEQQFRNMSSAIGSNDSAIDMTEDRHSKDGNESIDRTDVSTHKPDSPTTAQPAQFEQKAESPRRRTFFGKFRSHKH
ncbi:uncharacterized protein BCR38DRAFT_431383 [Pseudomassariella vexata]|uniref:Uncharacterized protein n=1 Tax=Pseudomassariella vexata TaxID=1141098 RepID=A0A1Y2E075_9PEZI|nr:uncharacterized protein BCR38DRAFT_431383 [Pseudomassariella vexata]ORY64938.1 hypothetical protein BCR38DRAFT_431383 [Pseudomassariella vexata]